jgi:hypothetical protein
MRNYPKPALSNHFRHATLDPYVRVGRVAQMVVPVTGWVLPLGVLVGLGPSPWPWPIC